MRPPPCCLMLLLNDVVYDGRVRNEARTLAAAGWRVLLVCNRQYPGPDLWPLGAGVDARRLRLFVDPPRAAGAAPATGTPRRVKLRLPGMKSVIDGLRWLEFALRALLLTRGCRVQAVHAHDLRTLPLGVLLARRFRAPLVYDAHELFPEMTGRGRIARALWMRIEARLAPQAHLVIAVGDAAATELARRYGLRRTAVIRNFPASPERTCRDGEESMVGGGGVPVPRPVLVHMGGLGGGRGLETLARALPRCQSNPSLLLVGTAAGDFERLKAALLKSGGEASRLHWVPPVPPEAVSSPVSQGSVGLISLERVSLNNCLALPNKLFLYLACGLPVVASDLPAIAGVVRRYGVGELFEPGSPASLAEAVDRLLLTPGRWSAAHRAALQAGTELVWEKEAPRLVRLYDELALTHRGSWIERGRGG